MRLLFKFLPIAIVAGLITYAVLIFFTSFNKSQIIGEKPKETFDTCLQKIGLENLTLLSTVAYAQKEVDAPISELWESFTLIQLWPEWSPIHTKIEVPEMFIFSKDATFTQTLELGFPLGEITSTEILDTVDDQSHLAMWWKKEEGLSSCHFWLFEDAGEGRTRISNIEIFDGPWSAIIKPIGQQSWSAKFQESVEGLVDYVNK